ncbi:MAG: GntR family transcriptional regulator [Actinomycetia bacterium]|nr:GntR family transcriptional regulator [Actinomycetes bacterium]
MTDVSPFPLQSWELVLNLAQIDRESDVPPFEQIMGVLRHAITSGQFAPGERLPTETRLADHFRVARTTVRRAVRELRSEGLLVPASGRGVAVRPAVAIRERWPQEPGYPAENSIPDFNVWGDAAPLITQAENIRTRVDVLHGDLEAVGLLAGEPAIAHKIVRLLGGVGLAVSDLFGTLAARVNWHIADPAHAAEVFEAMKTAQKAFADACGAAQAAARTLQHYVSKKSDIPSSPVQEQ